MAFPDQLRSKPILGARAESISLCSRLYLSIIVVPTNEREMHGLWKECSTLMKGFEVRRLENRWCPIAEVLEMTFEVGKQIPSQKLQSINHLFAVIFTESERWKLFVAKYLAGITRSSKKIPI
jgi:hypothetical protein